MVSNGKNKVVLNPSQDPTEEGPVTATSLPKTGAIGLDWIGSTIFSLINVYTEASCFVVLEKFLCYHLPKLKAQGKKEFKT